VLGIALAHAHLPGLIAEDNRNPGTPNSKDSPLWMALCLCGGYGHNMRH